MAQAYYAKNLSVTTSETVLNAAAEFTIDTILLIANDSLTGDLLIKLDGLGSTVSDWITLKPGEQLKNINLPVTVVRAKSSAGTVVGRILGLNN